jgi:hypothetical protein
MTRKFDAIALKESLTAIADLNTKHLRSFPASKDTKALLSKARKFHMKRLRTMVSLSRSRELVS